MKLKAGTKKARNVKIVDAMGNKIPYIIFFDTKTKEAEIFLRGSNDKIIVVKRKNGKNDLLSVKTVLLGCKAVDVTTLEEIK